MKHQEMFEAFYSIVSKGTGKECADFFNNQLEKAKGNEEELRFLLNSLRCHHHKGLIFEEADIFKTFENIIREEIERTTNQ